ncbi:hypothetical protein [Parafrankia sp. EUN1f]|uniref:hypothetical protein n=1 Tax=Parafrankia sp. EUN1f TaxID=102897 RepID=UPI0001C441C9|nr:hypothetical protein [Parafrankia sp. EUN1f]EFC86707.1 hypothetical protein FrEUN1fDRAFT_0189 [Parafrankia sp. EUN1f]
MAEVLATVAVGLVFAGWFAASVLNQFALGWWKRIVRYDLLGLVPRWTFFAPDPAREDVHIVYRDRSGTTRGPWRALTTAPPNPWVRWIWNPGRFERKASIDLVNGLRSSRQQLKEHPNALILSTPYVGLAGWVARQSRDSSAAYREFAVLTSMGFPPDQELSVEFASQAHRLES